jgi:hypothetical protein
LELRLEAKMNWYKRAQQQTFPFYDPSIDDPMVEQNAYERRLREDYATAVRDLTIEEFLEEHVNNEAELNQYFQILSLPMEKVDDFPNAQPIYVFEGRDKKTYVIDDFPESPDIVEAYAWVERIDDMYLTEYVQEEENRFWNEVGSGSLMYHGTYKDRVEDIMKNGIEARDEIRGITNRSTGSAVFLSADPETASYHYDKVIEIDLGAMKAAGYMPRAGGEEPIEEGALRSALASKLGLEDYYWEADPGDGLAEDTVIIYGNIPPQFLRVLE